MPIHFQSQLLVAVARPTVTQEQPPLDLPRVVLGQKLSPLLPQIRARMEAMRLPTARFGVIKDGRVGHIRAAVGTQKSNG